MEDINAWQYALTGSFVSLWQSVALFLPNIIISLLVLIVGMIIASSLGKLARKLIEITPVEKLARKTGLVRKMEESGIKFSCAKSVGWLVKWFFILIVILAISNILKLTVISDFINEIIYYVPNVIVAIVILVIGLVVSDFVHTLVQKSVEASKAIDTAAANLLAKLAKWVIVAFTFMAALSQLGIAKEMIHILFSGTVFMLALAGGLAFGLGGKERAAQWLNNLGKRE